MTNNFLAEVGISLLLEGENPYFCCPFAELYIELLQIVNLNGFSICNLKYPNLQ